MIFLITTGATGIIFCITGFTLFKFPPKKINSIIGYRTKASRANQKNWDYAQIKAGRELQWLGFTLIILGICAICLAMKG